MFRKNSSITAVVACNTVQRKRGAMIAKLVFMFSLRWLSGDGVGDRACGRS